MRAAWMRATVFVATTGFLLGHAPPAGAVYDRPYWTTTTDNLCTYSRCPTAELACESRLLQLQSIYPDSTLTRLEPSYHSSGSFLGVVCHFARSGGGNFVPPSRKSMPSYLWCQSGTYEERQGCVPIPKYVGSLERGCKTGNPVVVGSGAKLERTVDFRTAGPFALEFSRYYNAQRARWSSVGSKWAGSFDRWLTFVGSYRVYVNRPDGEVLRFDYNNGDYLRRYGSSWIKDSIESLTKTADGWEFRDAASTVETYTSGGELVSITSVGGYQQTLTHDSEGNPTAVIDSFGRQLTFTYVDDKLETMIAPDGGVYHYLYDQAGPATNDRLARVLYPDDTPGDDGDNPSVTYLYEDPDFPFALTGIIDENGDRFATWAYDDSLRATLSAHAGGADRITLTYDDAGKTRTITNALGKQTTYRFAEIQRKWKVTQVEGHASANCVAANTDYSHDGRGFVDSTTDWNGNVTTYVNENSLRGLPLTRTEAVGTLEQRTTTMTWHPDFRLPTQIVEPERTIDLTYDAAGNLLTRSETDTGAGGQTRTWTFTYTTAGLLASADGPRTDVSDVTTYDYTTSGFLSKVTNALGHEIEITSHNGRGLPLVMIDENGVESTLTYTPRGWLESVTVDSGAGGTSATTTFAYDGVGRITRVTLPDGSALNYAYDAAHRLTAVSNDLGERIDHTLDAMGGRTQTVVKASGGAVKRTQGQAFDELGRLLQRIGGASQTRTFGYDPNGNLTSETDGLNNTWSYAFDALDRLVQETDPLSGLTDYGYDDQDALTGVTDPRDLVTTYVRDGFGQVVQETSPDRGTTVYTRDAAGNVISQMDARGVVTQFTYDALNRVTSKTFPAGPSEDVTYGYDATAGGNFGIGRLTSVVGAVGSTAFVYDARGNLIEERRSQGGQLYVTGYGYDLADRLTRIVYPSGRIVTYQRDSLGRVSAVETQDDDVSPVVSLASNLTYLPFGPLASLDFGNGLGLALSYDQDYRLTGIETFDGGSNWVQDLAYGLDANDRVATINDALDPASSQTYTYDALNRLIQGQGAYGTIGYGYDALGNRLWRTITDGGTVTETYAYDAFSNRLLSVDDGATVRSFGYAADGSVIGDDRGVDVFDLAYDAAGRLVEVDRNSALEASYAYDAFGRRVFKDPAGGGATHYHYDPDGRLLAESSATGVPEREYVWLPLDGQAWALPLALITDASTAAPRVHYIHTDHLGTPLVMTSSGLASIEWSAQFRPFGEVHAITSTKTLDLRFPGQLLDSETGFHENWHRDYDPSLGRYLQSDPIGLEGGLNTYAYVGGDPVSLIDPTGTTPALVPALVACMLDPLCAVPLIGAASYATQALGQLCPLPDWSLSKSSNEQSDKPPFRGEPGSRVRTLIPMARPSRRDIMAMMDSRKRTSILITITVRASRMYMTGIAHLVEGLLHTRTDAQVGRRTLAS
jgi:RHS repeat-associated protein